MRKFHALRQLLLAIPLAASASACVADKTPAAPAADRATKLTVHKSPTCGCCAEWVDHVKTKGFVTEVHDTGQMNAIKQQLGIEPRYQSCHTAVTESGDYFFEGHVPVTVVQRFLAEKPEGAIGLAVPGMPAGSPGMEMGGRFDAYDVYQINSDGSVTVYAKITSPQQQY